MTKHMLAFSLFAFVCAGDFALFFHYIYRVWKWAKLWREAVRRLQDAGVPLKHNLVGVVSQRHLDMAVQEHEPVIGPEFVARYVQSRRQVNIAVVLLLVLWPVLLGIFAMLAQIYDW